jgi:Cys-rich repeat protein
VSRGGVVRPLKANRGAAADTIEDRLMRYLFAFAVCVAAAGCAVTVHPIEGGSGGGTTHPGTGGGGGSGVCKTSADCPSPPNTCVVATCVAGACGTQNVPVGAMPTPNVPGDCHATACDGMGKLYQVVDPSNVPPSTPCLVGTCDAMGIAGTSPVTAGMACNAGMGSVCDGMGQCVQCLKSSDCPNGQSCSAAHTCAMVSCMDGVQNGQETDVDCGGPICAPCAAGKKCKVDSDCTSMACDALTLVCDPNQCTDHKKDGTETDVDCGGGTCPACPVGLHCLVDADCTSNACDVDTLTCVANQCEDHQQDGNETDVDCGGPVCPACIIGQKCKVNSDCADMACDANTLICASSECTDHKKDGQETDVDCGGPVCMPCVVGKNCLVNTDCISQACDLVIGMCASSTCQDQQKDGQETDVDCGGPVCAPCAVGKKCLVDSDCTSMACDAIILTCVSNQCMDHLQDGAETDVDCGGGTCPACATGKKCNVNTDCITSSCNNGLCN